MQKSHAFLKELWSYACMKIVFWFFLLIYSWCDVLASLAARHTTVCLDASIQADAVNKKRVTG